MNYDPIKVKLTPGEREIAFRPVVNKGGVQQRLRKILNRIAYATGEGDVLPTDEAYMREFCEKRGSGGYQDRFQAILWAVDRTRSTGV